MSIGSQFSGINMDQLIGAPLRAAADASVQLADSTAKFINEVGFDKDGKTRTAAFKYYQTEINPDGTRSNNEMNMEVPLLAIVPIPNLQVDEVNILFDMEVKQSEREEKATDLSATLTGEAKIGPVKISVSGSVSSHSSNTRSSDNSAKYHVDVRAANHGTPEGLARVLDVMAASASPALIGSTVVDENGKALEGARKERAEKLKRLQQEKLELEDAANAAEKVVLTDIERLKKEGESKKNGYVLSIQKKLVAIEEKESDTDDQKAANEKQKKDLTDAQETVIRSWDLFKSQIKEKVEMAADSETESKLHEIMDLMQADNTGVVSKISDDIPTLSEMFGKAIKSQKQLKECRNKSIEKTKEYNSVQMG